ncbi:FecR family protein [Chryseobacterium polytrichastri]|uniref:FecR family protein n=1 Tax=Chryseobacterium polytrichastri TaxID=1302687 RepID=A0A1M7DQA8_9FLAO|nr:FecR family protein [Chryseobacterium polytrichastri]SHL81680.1 FecR family protein [Chryseobacterium polytrichastri]
MQHNEAKELFLKYQSGQCTAEEKAIVEDWLLFGKLTEFNLSDEELEQEMKYLDSRLPIEPIIRKHSFRYQLPVAAVLLITIGLGIHFYNKNPLSNSGPVNSIAYEQGITPGTNKATLTMSNGETFHLKGNKDQMLLQETGLKITNTKQGQLVYDAHHPINAHNPIQPESLLATHTVTTPRGGQYEIILPDGTKVWLNASSSLKFPALFTAQERNVELKGEAYFEVAKNAAKPFQVLVNTTVVRVLGTHFNITAYSDEPNIKTTLLEGAVQVNNRNRIDRLKPGQQSIIGKHGEMKVVNAADTEHAVAWKNGYFYFNRTSLAEIMKQLSRWYDVDVSYKGRIPVEEEFVGKITRKASISEILNVLELSGVHHKVINKRIILTSEN